jgi:fatty-acyl-CoA synthase
LNSIHAALPAYSRPLFLRLQREMEITTTFKHRKVDLQQQGFDITKISDPLYYRADAGYVPIDAELYQKLTAIRARL